jgi:tRNA (adenine57-N1/adenine58-N1)-methyltransferase
VPTQVRTLSPAIKTMKVKKVLVRNGKRYYWAQGDLHTLSGVVKEDDIKKGKEKVFSHHNKEFQIFDANFVDEIMRIKRGPATMTKKDIGYVIANSGIDKESIVVDAGSGCGVSAMFIGRVAKKVVTYEINEEFYNTAKKNIEELEIKNVEIKKKSINDGIDENELDLVLLDLPEPWHVIKHAEKALKSGKFLVSYLPTSTQVEEMVNNAGNGFIHEKTIELMEREWHVEGKKVRPKSRMIGHTGFLVFLRKI